MSGEGLAAGCRGMEADERGSRQLLKVGSVDEIARILGAGLPWPATLAIVFVTVLSTKVVDGWLKIRKASMDERAYEDGQTKEGYEALVAQLREQVKELKGNVSEVLLELREVRSAHSKCEIEQEKLRGEIKAMSIRMEVLERHDQRNTEHVEQLKNKLTESGENKIV